MDFTLKAYHSLLATLLQQGFSFHPLEEEPFKREGKIICLRHDVDLLPENALETAQIEHDLGIKGSYYFRIVPESNCPEIIQKIIDLGHEIGYHYEDLPLCAGWWKREYNFSLNDVNDVFLRGNTKIGGFRKTVNNFDDMIDRAYGLFQKHLEYFRKFYPVKTICMHGSPKSRYDSRDIWKKYNYRDLGIIAEPYFDIDFNQVFYLTDTGRRWDGWKVSVRDKVPQQAEWNRQGLVFHSTNDIIKAAQENNLPNKIMITVHPQRWTDKPLPWVKELVWQGVKNVVKGVVVRRG